MMIRRSIDSDTWSFVSRGAMWMIQTHRHSGSRRRGQQFQVGGLVVKSVSGSGIHSASPAYDIRFRR